MQFLEEMLFDPNQLSKMDLGFLQRAHLAAALGLHPRFIFPLKALAKIRNKFAHRLDVELTASEAENFYSAFDPVDKQIIQKIYDRTRKSSAKRRPSRMISLDPIERFSLCVAALRGAIVSA